MTLRSSFKPEMLEKYTDAFDQGFNQNSPGRLLAYNWYSGSVQTAHELSRPTFLGNLT